MDKDKSNPVADGGPAFPTKDVQVPGGEWLPPGYGMSLRDYFAGQYASGVIAASVSDERCVRDVVEDDELARESYSFADAMLRERAKGGS